MIKNERKMFKQSVSRIHKVQSSMKSLVTQQSSTEEQIKGSISSLAHMSRSRVHLDPNVNSVIVEAFKSFDHAIPRETEQTQH